jgi:hypothetical protein
MTGIASEDARGAEPGEHSHPGLQDLNSYSLVNALQQRRTRRIARGVSLRSRGLTHESENSPEPLTPVEEAILIVTTGISGGAVMHDGPLEHPDGRYELPTPFMNVLGRTGSSADNAQATSFFMLNDEGTWLIQRLQGRRAVEFLREVPRHWSDWKEEHWLAAADAVKRKVYDARLDYPRRFPYYIGWNNQHSNVPGSTLFFPLVDCTYQYLNGIMIMLSHPQDQRPLVIDDFSRFRPRTPLDWAAWVASKLGFVDKIPYQPIGGIKRAKSGLVNPENFIPLGYARTLRTDYEAFFLMQNLMLMGEALGVGGWIHGSIMPPFVMQRDESQGFLGLDFRQHGPAIGEGKWAPLPAGMPNYVGIDGVLEGLCPPYVESMDEAVDRVLEMKFGPDGCYGNKEIFARAYSSPAAAEEYLAHADPYKPEVVAYTREIATYVYDRYGRFPAHVNSFYCPGMWVQFSHLELEYYERYGDPSFYERQARHDSVWHDGKR